MTHLDARGFYKKSATPKALRIEFGLGKQIFNGGKAVLGTLID